MSDRYLSSASCCHAKGHDNLSNIVDRLMNGSRISRGVRRNSSKPLPSVVDITKIVDLLRSVVFPKCFGPEDVDTSSLSFHIGARLDLAYHLLQEQLHRGYCFQCDGEKDTCSDCENKARKTADLFLERLPDIAETMNSDVRATYLGDPAAVDENEIIFCYPGVSATFSHRIAHEMYQLGSPIIARILSEDAHSKTGIDIHPGAQIGEGFMIDHGTGVVIGETCTIGKHVKIYQGVTLGAKSFPLDDDGNPIKGIKRHPQIGDNAIIYSGATLLGHITIGEESVIGGNVWLTESVPPHSRLLQTRFRTEKFIDGAGI